MKAGRIRILCTQTWESGGWGGGGVVDFLKPNIEMRNLPHRNLRTNSETTVNFKFSPITSFGNQKKKSKFINSKLDAGFTFVQY